MLCGITEQLTALAGLSAPLSHLNASGGHDEQFTSKCVERTCDHFDGNVGHQKLRRRKQKNIAKQKVLKIY